MLLAPLVHLQQNGMDTLTQLREEILYSDGNLSIHLFIYKTSSFKFAELLGEHTLSRQRNATLQIFGLVLAVMDMSETF